MRPQSRYHVSELVSAGTVSERGSREETFVEERADGMNIRVLRDGPYSIAGGIPLLRVQIVTNDEGESVAYREIERIDAGPRYQLCRCGKSKSKPFCDGTHTVEGFDGTETAEHDGYIETAACIDGPSLKLRDARKLCAEARYCDRFGGLWNLVKTAETPEERDRVEAMAELCPSGRYTICDPDDTQHEPEFEPSIALIEDPALGVSGPIWVRGRIPIRAADGDYYEVRNRMTLCRCGRSGNKPFCDGSHIASGFRDESAPPLSAGDDE